MKPTLFISVLIIFTALLSPVSKANPLHSPNIQLAQSKQGLGAAVESIKQKTGGRILSTKTINQNGQKIHKIKVLLPSGKVRVFKVTAQ
ncbi:MAG: hypothetical protein OEY78_00530 [Gammaproteobacteria bacterium]|nr:hypothetical protein [Gammaproteobacteria bacterium]